MSTTFTYNDVQRRATALKPARPITYLRWFGSMSLEEKYRRMRVIVAWHEARA